MATVHTCDYCRAAIDTSSPEAMIVEIRRGVDDDEWGDTTFVSGGVVRLRFCGQAHLAAHAERIPLPPVTHDDDEDDDDGLIGCVVGLVVLVVFLALAAGAAYGLLQLVRQTFF